MSTANQFASEFNMYLHMYKRHYGKLNQEGETEKIYAKDFFQILLHFQSDRVLANKWVTKLKEFNTKLADLKMRNAILCTLVMQMQVGTLTAPFNIPPRFASLDQVQPIPELNAENVFPAGMRLPQIMQQSPDQGAFLVSQPVPKCGAFCYLAVVSRPANN